MRSGDGVPRDGTVMRDQIIGTIDERGFIGAARQGRTTTPARLQGSKHKKAVFLLGEHKKRHLRAGDGAMLCECFANGLKISPRCDGGLAHRWRAP